MTAIFHFTHEANLESILAEGALLCDQQCRAAGRTARAIAYSNLKQQRAMTAVEVLPGGTLHNYVPFYFGPRSPMLYAYKGGYVTGRPEDQDEIIYLATMAESVAGGGFRFAFTDGHPLREPKAFYNDLTHLNQVDLELMKATYWNDTNEDPDRKRRRQAEFLVWERVPLALLQAFAVRTEAKQIRVQEMAARHALEIPCYVRSSWYYD